VAADIFGGGLQADVDALFEGTMIKRRRQVLSSMTSAPRAWAAAAMAGMSGISKDCDPGASTSTARVFCLNSRSIPRPISGSK
jgi:hypothetical protein